MSLTDLHIEGYRSVRNLRLPVRQLTVLVGANGVGKTNIYRALELVRAAATGELAMSIAREGGLASVLWAGQRRAGDPPRLCLEVGLDLDGPESDAVFLPRYRVEIGFGDSKYQAVFAEEPQIKFESLALPGRRAVTLLERKGPAGWYRDDNGGRRQFERDDGDREECGWMKAEMLHLGNRTGEIEELGERPLDIGRTESEERREADHGRIDEQREAALVTGF